MRFTIGRDVLSNSRNSSSVVGGAVALGLTMAWHVFLLLPTNSHCCAVAVVAMCVAVAIAATAVAAVVSVVAVVVVFCCCCYCCALVSIVAVLVCHPCFISLHRCEG